MRAAQSRDRLENGFAATFKLPTLVNKLTKRFRCWQTFIVWEAGGKADRHSLCPATPIWSVCFIHETALEHTHAISPGFVPTSVYLFPPLVYVDDNRRSIS